MLQHQAYAACDDEVIRERVRELYARLVAHVERLSGAESERIDEFFRYGMWLNVAAAMGVEDLSVGCEWVRAEALGPRRRAEPRRIRLAVSRLRAARDTAAARRRGSAPRTRRRRRTGAPPDGSQGLVEGTESDADLRIVAAVRLNSAEPQSPQNHFSAPPPGLQARSRSSPVRIRNVPGAARPLAEAPVPVRR